MPNSTKIMIIRHAEKPTTNPTQNPIDFYGTPEPDSLIVRGWQRAGALAVLFAPARGPLQHPLLTRPENIYASSTSAEGGNRPEETVTPLWELLEIVPNFDFANTDLVGVATSAMNCGGSVLIAWPHGQIPALARQIPLSPININPIPGTWPSDRFDIVFVFDIAPLGGYIFNQVPQLLLAQDSSELIPTS